MRRKFLFLAANAHFLYFRFVPFVRHRLLRRFLQRLFISILRQTVMAPDHLAPTFNPYQPFRFAPVPRNFHAIRTHVHLPLTRYRRHVVTFLAASARRGRTKRILTLSTLFCYVWISRTLSPPVSAYTVSCSHKSWPPSLQAFLAAPRSTLPLSSNPLGSCAASRSPSPNGVPAISVALSCKRRSLSSAGFRPFGPGGLAEVGTG